MSHPTDLLKIPLHLEVAKSTQRAETARNVAELTELVLLFSRTSCPDRLHTLAL